MILRSEKTDDLEAISALHHAAFLNHPQHPPGSGPVEHLIVERLRAAGGLVLSLLAEEDGATVGHIAMSPAVVGRDASHWYLLGPVGVLPAYQGRGIGSALVREALGEMKRRGASGIVLVGDPGFYERFGFRTFKGLTYAGVPPQYVLAAAFGSEHPCGAIAAHTAFG
jgi:putative acetyltransferase